MGRPKGSKNNSKNKKDSKIENISNLKNTELQPSVYVKCVDATLNNKETNLQNEKEYECKRIVDTTLMILYLI